MAFDLLQVGKQLLLPPASLLLLWLAGLLLGRRQPRRGHRLQLAAIVLLYLLSTSPGAWLLVHPLERLEAPLAAGAGGAAQAIVVLTASRVRGPGELGNGPDAIGLARAVYAGQLQRRSGLPILVSGGLPPKDGGASLAADMARQLGLLGIPVRWREEASTNTADNAAFAGALLRRDGIDTVLLVTDAMHMRRARLEFERAGLHVIAAPTMFVGGDFVPWRLAPGAESLRRASYAVYEWLGLLVTLTRSAASR